MTQNTQFTNFFRNSFIHYCLNMKNMCRYDGRIRLEIAKEKCEQIVRRAEFLVGTDTQDENVFYCYIAYRLSGKDLYLYMAYVKKNFRGYGLFRTGLKKLTDVADNVYYVLPVTIKKNSFLDEIQYRELFL